MVQVSVVVPTYNRQPRLKHVLAGLECQQYPLANFEVIVVSDGSTDATHGYVRDLATPLNLTLAIQENSGPAAARNHGIKRSTGSLVVFIDDDVVPSPQLLSEHVRIHAEQADVAVLGPMVTPTDFAMRPWVSWEQAMLHKQYIAMQRGKWQASPRQFYTGNTSLPRVFLVDAGGFDEHFRRAEDVELAYRLAQRGLKFVFNPHALGYHYAERSFQSWLETPYVYGRNDVIFARDKQQGWLLAATEDEFHKRNPLIKLMVKACLGRSLLSRGMLGILKQIALMGQHLQPVTRSVYSAIFNLRYYQGMADELGGREEFWNIMAPSYGPALPTD